MNEIVRVKKERKINGIEKVKRIYFLSFKLYRKGSQDNNTLAKEVIKSPYKGVKLFSIFKIIVNHIPAFILNKFFRSKLDFSELPINLNEFSLDEEVYNNGFEQALFLLKSKKFGDKILKVDFYQLFLGRTEEEIRSMAVKNNKMHMLLEHTFGKIKGVIIPTTFYFTAISPFQRKETQMCLVDCITSEQPFIDMFNTGGIEKVKQTIVNNPDFRVTLADFCTELFKLAHDGVFLDFAGKENLVIAIIKNEPKICLLDCQSILERSKEKMYLKWLKELEEVSSQGTGVTH